MKKPLNLFITGTDTEVGKSVVTAALAASAIGPVAALKPIASGVKAGEAGEDALEDGDVHGQQPAHALEVGRARVKTRHVEKTRRVGKRVAEFERTDARASVESKREGGGA